MISLNKDPLDPTDPVDPVNQDYLPRTCLHVRGLFFYVVTIVSEYWNQIIVALEAFKFSGNTPLFQSNL